MGYPWVFFACGVVTHARTVDCALTSVLEAFKECAMNFKILPPQSMGHDNWLKQTLMIMMVFGVCGGFVLKHIH